MCPESAPALGRAVMLLMFGLPAVLCFIGGLVMLAKLLRTPRRPLEAMASIVGMLDGTGAFTNFSPQARKERDALPLVVRRHRVLDASGVPLSLSRLSARSSSHSLGLEVDLCELAWPEGTLPEQRFVPDRWLTTELSGGQIELDSLPTGPREEQRDGLVRWTFTGAEIDAGDAEQHFRQVAAALGVGGAKAGPYR